jgi:hypothetical protein
MIYRVECISSITATSGFPPINALLLAKKALKWGVEACISKGLVLVTLHDHKGVGIGWILSGVQ